MIREALQAQAPKYRRIVSLLLLMSPFLMAGCDDSFVPKTKQQGGSSVSLADVFPFADVVVETSYLDIGTPEARPYLLSGWSHDERGGGGTFVWAVGDRSQVRLVVPEPRPLHLRFYCAPFRFPGAPTQRMRVAINGHPVDEVPLFPSWGSGPYEVDVPQGLLVAGNNLLELQYRYTQRPIDVLPGAKGSRSLAVAWDAIEVDAARSYGYPTARPQATPPGLIVPFQTEVTYAFDLPRGGLLAWQDLRPWGKARGQNGAELKVTLVGSGSPDESTVGTETQNHPGVLLYEGALPPGTPVQGIELAPWTEGPVSLSLRAVPGASPPDGDAGFLLIAPGVRTRATIDVRPSRQAAQRMDSSTSRRPHILVYLVDTLRADHLGVYGYERETSPHLDQLAEEAAVFLSATAQSAWTRASTASVLSGLYPQTHGTNDRDDSLPTTFPVLPELLKSLGYQTFGLVANGNVSRSFGFDRGFDEFFEFLSDGESTPSVEMHELALQLMEQRDPEHPVFLYLHTVDPHDPYVPRQPYLGKMTSREIDPSYGTLEFMRSLRAGDIEPTPRLVEDLEALYDSEIAFNDAKLGNLLEGLKDLGVFEDSIIIFLSDHGEEFFEHGHWTHGRTLFEEQLRVPLLMRFPDGSGRGARVAGTARLVDIVPTLLDYLGSSSPATIQGASLLPILRGEDESKSPSFSYLKLDGQEMASISLRSMKLIQYERNLLDRPGSELYDLARDPGEGRNLTRSLPIWSLYLRSVLRSSESSWGTGATPGKAVLDENLRQHLRALGYLQ